MSLGLEERVAMKRRAANLWLEELCTITCLQHRGDDGESGV